MFKGYRILFLTGGLIGVSKTGKGVVFTARNFVTQGILGFIYDKFQSVRPTDPRLANFPK